LRPAACFNPITAIPPKQNDLNIDPFTVDILIGLDSADARSIAGPDADRIKGDLRNILQLVVLNASGDIIAFDEVRRQSDAEPDALLRIDSVPFGDTYHFLLLMGHWNRDYTEETGETYKYTSDPPTLLAAGLKTQLVSGSGKITVTMWPIVVDTEFTVGNLSAGPVVNTGKPGKVTLHPVEWNVSWTIKRGLKGNGLTDLIAAQKKPDATAGDALKYKNLHTLAREGDVEPCGPCRNVGERHHPVYRDLYIGVCSYRQTGFRQL
jgi:hypothetical protein